MRNEKTDAWSRGGQPCRPACKLAALLADGRRECRLKLLFQKCRGMRELVSNRMCLALERVDALEVEIAALGEV